MEYLAADSHPVFPQHPWAGSRQGEPARFRALLPQVLVQPPLALHLFKGLMQKLSFFFFLSTCKLWSSFYSFKSKYYMYLAITWHLSEKCFFFPLSSLSDVAFSFFLRYLTWTVIKDEMMIWTASQLAKCSSLCTLVETLVFKNRCLTLDASISGDELLNQIGGFAIWYLWKEITNTFKTEFNLTFSIVAFSIKAFLWPRYYQFRELSEFF